MRAGAGGGGGGGWQAAATAMVVPVMVVEVVVGNQQQPHGPPLGSRHEIPRVDFSNALMAWLHSNVGWVAGFWTSQLCMPSAKHFMNM